MKRSLWTLTLIAVVVLVALPGMAATPAVTKSIAGSDDGSAVVVVRVTAANESVYGVTIKDASGSIEDIVAPKGWVGISSGSDVIFRTGDKPIRAGSSLSFRLITSNEDAGLSVSFRNMDNTIGSGRTL